MGAARPRTLKQPSTCAPLPRRCPCTPQALFKEAQGLGNPQGAWTPHGRVPNPHAPSSEGSFVRQERMLPLAQSSAFVSRMTASLRRAAGWFGSSSLGSRGRVSADSIGQQCWPVRSWSLAPETKSGAACTSRQRSEWESLPLTFPWGAAGHRAFRSPATFLQWTRQESLQKPNEPCKPVAENKISRGACWPQ